MVGRAAERAVVDETLRRGAGALVIAGEPAIVPALGAAGAERHRVHRALRDLLERLAAARPLVICLDDVHWADPASLDALVALAHRPPEGAVLLAFAARTGRLAPALDAALA